MALLVFRAIVLVLGFASAFSTCPSDVCDCSNYATRKEIRCMSRQLTSVPQNLPSDTQTLRLEFNNLTSIDTNNFANLSALKRLTLYNNQISAIAPGSFAALRNLERLKLENNRIESLGIETFQGLGKLLELNLDNNRLVNISNGTFKHLLKLTELTISLNPLQYLPTGLFSNLATLGILDISRVDFQTIPSTLFDGLAQLHTLRMNSITDKGDEVFSAAVFHGISNLTTLEVRNNSLSCIPSSFSALHSLEALTASQNPLTCNDFSVMQSFPLLQHLILTDTNMTKLTSGMFANNSQLQTLDFADSKLSSIEDNAFIGLNQLTELYLFSNHLTTLPSNALSHLPSNVFLDIADNPWHCDCNLRWLTGLLVNLDANFQPVCVTPDRVSTRELVSLDDADFACMPENVATNTNRTVNNGDDVRLECGITGDPSPQLQWLTPDHMTLQPGSSQPPFLVSNDGTLTIVRIRVEDSGSYSCIGSNLAGRLSVLNTVDVKGTVTDIQSIPTSTPAHQTTPLKTTSNMIPKSAQTGSVPMHLIAILVVIVLIVLIIILVVSFVVRSRRKRKDDHQARFIRRNESAFESGRCNQTCSDGCAVVNFNNDYSDARYADSIRRPVCEPPPPYTAQQSQDSVVYDQIYDHIDDSHYESPMSGLATFMRQTPPLNHDYCTSMKQSSDTTDDSSFVRLRIGNGWSSNPPDVKPTSPGATVDLGLPPVDQSVRLGTVENPSTVHYHNACAGNGLLPRSKDFKAVLQEQDTKDNPSNTYQNVAREKPPFTKSDQGK